MRRSCDPVPALFAALLAALLAGCGDGSASPAPSVSNPAGGAGSPSAGAASSGGTPGPSAAGSATVVPGSPTAAPGGAFDPAHVQLTLVEVASGLAAPLYLAGAGDGSGRRYIVEQVGRIRLLDAAGQLLDEPFLDIRDRIASGGERGLLGLAFDPRYAQNGRFFVDYTDRAGNTVVAAYRRLDALHADPGSELVLLHIGQPFPNHNGGQLAFGPDGLLYIGVGDGGSGGDPLGNGQRLDTLLGKLLRLDVSGGGAYAIPPGNLVGSRPAARPEIWAYGLRNPWRFSFDRATGDLFVADVGEGSYEELDAVPAGSGAGLDFGWRIMEGRHCFGSASCNTAGLTLPALEIAHGHGDCAITGGYVYRGPASPALSGGYLFGDYCSGRIWAVAAAAALRGPVAPTLLLETGLGIGSFGQDDAGELYVCDLAGGRVYLITAAPR